ncbi:hypothetical protein VE03_10079 [Pseudogymnoascus sp. 23342-1-I1]|nr:hypothetical protein VE03_10079 [Pseudogymnoascus sp. 23342-1-I1]
MAARKKGAVFRITGLPASQPDSELNKALKAAIDDNLAEDEQSKLTVNAAIVPSCYDNNEKVALAEFHGGVPAFLSGLVADPLGDWQVEMDGTDISFDQHFFGFTQLYTPKPGLLATADIIAITGLDGHAYGSWRGKGNLGRMWLRDFLSKDLPCYRTMIYGYNSKLLTHGVDTIMDYGRGLTEELKKVRNTEERRKRPLFFIAHSFSGIILAHRRTGDFVTIVDADSALLQLPDSVEDKIPLDADHSMMIKFDNRNNRGYTSARDKLRQFHQDAPSVVAARFLRAENRPKPSSMVPFQRDSAFVGREDILAEIGEKFEQAASQDHCRVALVGLGGIGKSQIAIEYAHRLRESAPQTWVFWVHASNASRFKLAYTNIAAKIELPSRDDPKANIFRLVANSNGVAHRGGAPHEEAPLESFLPQSSDGWILVTSRNLVAAANLIGTRHNVIQVEPMAEKDALMLLKTRVSVSEAFEDDAKTLVQKLGYIPLAVTHAAAYLALSFEQIRKTTPEAAELLSLMAMLDGQGIQGSILYNDRGRLQFEDAVAPLTSFSLIKVQSMKQPEQQVGEHLFEMHDLVQLATRKWLEVQMQLGKWQRASLQIMAAAFLSGQHETWAACRALLPHARKVHSYVLEEKKATLDRARISDNIAWYLLLTGEYAAAEKIGRTAVEGRKEVLRVEHPDSLTSVSRLGSVLEKQGKYEEAEAMQRRALGGREKVLGVEHPDTLTSVSNVGWVLEKQGKYEEAEAMQRRALEGREKVLGVEHPDTLTSVSQLGSVLEKQGKYEEAEAMHWRDLKGSEKVLGVEHPDTLTSVSNVGWVLEKQGNVSQLGWVLEKQGKYEEAEAMQRRALEGREKVLGVEHPDTLTSVSQLGSVLEKQGKYEEAEAMNIGWVLERRGKYEEAEAMHWRALEGSEKVLGAEHPNTLTSVSNVGLMLSRQGKYEEAEAMQRRALEGSGKVLGVEHPDTLAAMGQLVDPQYHSAFLTGSELEFPKANREFGPLVNRPAQPSIAKLVVGPAGSRMGQTHGCAGVYSILLGDFKDETKDSAKVFNPVLYLVSHAATFKWRTRSVVRAAYEERFVLSSKQKAALDKWEKMDAAKLAEEDAGDVTTEEEPDCYYDSDYSISI